MSFWYLVWANLTSYKFSFFFFPIPLYIFQIYDVFMNKILEGCIILQQWVMHHFKVYKLIHKPIGKKRMLQIFRTSCLQKLWNNSLNKPHNLSNPNITNCYFKVLLKKAHKYNIKLTKEKKSFVYLIIMKNCKLYYYFWFPFS